MNVLPCKLDANGFDQIETEEAIRQFCTKHYFSRDKEDTILCLFRTIESNPSHTLVFQEIMNQNNPRRR